MTAWPALPGFADWAETSRAVQLWTQIVGKVRLTLTPWLNHSWHVALYLTPRGLGTGIIHHAGGPFELEFDFITHRLVLRRSGGPDTGFALAAMSVADFYARTMALLAGAGIAVAIDTLPNEIPDGTAFPDDIAARPYDAAAIAAFWRALVEAHRVFTLFRTDFLGKASPVHFFWGSFDLAATRFSGRRAPLHPGGFPGLPDPVTQEAYSHEESSAGFWPGDAGHEASFYSYAYPSPEGFKDAAVAAPAVWDAALGEWLLPYAAVQTAADPDAVLLTFLQSTYRAAADLAGWDPSLDCGLGVPRIPRAV